ncbi:MAG: YkgJ family cysteine cluster protein [Limnohabitans sp.]|uniref:YkgJ family cysteine cluster protein n=1 Tax=Limnohabitans sp. TaxID=1907725 RepID=UPI003BB1FFB1
MNCRSGCAACCTAPSISSPIPGMPSGKPAGVPCIQLNEQLRCKIFGQPERPAVCGQLQASVEMCGPLDDQGQFARIYLTRLEQLTRPDI